MWTRYVPQTYADYDRLHFASAETQKRCFDLQLQMATKVRLPLFLHSRAAHKDFVDILRPYLNSLRPPEIQTDKSSPGSVGVVHSFTGTAEELHELLDLGLYIGVNGCSLKTQENLDVVKQIPLHRILLETGMCSLTNGRRPVVRYPPHACFCQVPGRVQGKGARASCCVLAAES